MTIMMCWWGWDGKLGTHTRRARANAPNSWSNLNRWARSRGAACRAIYPRPGGAERKREKTRAPRDGFGVREIGMAHAFSADPAALMASAAAGRSRSRRYRAAVIRSSVPSQVTARADPAVPRARVVCNYRINSVAILNKFTSRSRAHTVRVVGAHSSCARAVTY